ASTSTGTGASTTTTMSTTTTATSSVSSSTGGPPCASRDCGDPTCADSFACVPDTPPAPWMGYYALFDGPTTKLPTCTADYADQAHEGSGGLMFQPATCPCTCGTPSGGSCDIGELDISDAACMQQGMCTGPVTPPAGYTPGTCFNFPMGGGFVYYG